MRAMQCVEPLEICVPLTQPRSAIVSLDIEILILIDAERQIVLPTDALEVQMSVSILREIADRQITQAQVAVCIVTREYQRLMGRIVADPDHVFVDVLVIEQGSTSSRASW